MAKLDSARAILAESVVFQGLGAADLDPVVAASTVVARKPEDVILSEGAPGDGLYIVLEGEIEIFLPERPPGGGRRPTRVRLNQLGPGRCVGEYSVIDDRPSSASAVALSPTRLCFIPKASFRALVENHDRVGRIVYRNLLRYLVSRLRGKDQELDVVLLLEERRA